MDHTLLNWIIFIPMMGMAAILLCPKRSVGLIKVISLVATFIPLVLATWLYFVGFEVGSPAYQFEFLRPWITSSNEAMNMKVNYHVGVDGISLPLVWLTTLLLFIGVPASFGIKKGEKAYYALLLLLEVGIIGVFVSLDYFLFYVFWEIMLLPMYFLIGIWGGPRRDGGRAHRLRRASTTP